MRTITIFKKTENRTVKNEIIHNMQPDDIQRKLSGSISRELNCIDSLSCDIYPDNPGYEMLVPCLTEIQCIDDNDVEFYLNTFMTTSPSYLIMSSLDYARYYLDEYGYDEKKILNSMMAELADDPAFGKIRG